MSSKAGEKKRTRQPKNPIKTEKKKRKNTKYYIRKKTLPNLPKRRAFSNNGNSSGRNRSYT